MKKSQKIIIAALSVLVGLLAVALVCLTVFYVSEYKRISSGNGDFAETYDGETVDKLSPAAMSDAAVRPGLLSERVTLEKTDVTANVEPITVSPDLSDVYNYELYYFDGEERDKLVNNQFVIDRGIGNYEFFEVYEENRYYYESNFVTVDSLMHTYHLYFSHLLKNLEKNELFYAVSEMSRNMLEESNVQYSELKGTEWEDAAKRNLIFFAVANNLCGNNAHTVIDVSSEVNSELSKISNATGIDKCVITDDYEDYTQYIPRGYYEGDPNLEAYFKTMMWYGRIQFNTKSEDMIRSSMLMTLALDNAGITAWKDVYDISSFFVGSSDDLGYYEYHPILVEIYGDNVSASDLSGDTKKFNEFAGRVRSLKLPEVNSIPIDMGDDNVIQGFRFMGQRFTIDAMIMQNLIYQNVHRNSNNECRMLPDVLDVTAALGSDVSRDILEEQGNMDYEGYADNLDRLRADLSKGSTEEYFSKSLYGNWLNTLRPLLKEKGEGYPTFMQSKAWAKKDIECFAGSYTELKHDTILYAKQCMAEMGSGEIPEFDDRGYVQPEPLVYARFKYMADATREGLLERGRINSTDQENLVKLAELAEALKVISEKELREEVLTDEEYDLIREYGGALEHFWYEAISADVDDEYINTEKYQAALVVDVATDPNGQVLELATGQPNYIYVIVRVDGKVKIAKGSVYSFYQFPWPMSDRLTDSKWREMMAYEPDENGFFGDNWRSGDPVERPSWTQEYSYKYVYKEKN